MVNTMTVNQVGIRAKAVVRKKGFTVSWWMFAVPGLLLAIAGTLGFDVYSGKLGIIGPQFEIVANGANKIIKVPPGGNVQAAIERAEAGDIVELQAGAVYYGEIKLPNKPFSDYVTIQSSAASSLPAGKRVGPAQKSSMATILTRTAGRPAISAANGANHYRFIGIEFSSATAEYVYNLVLLGNGETAANLPHDIEIDRCYLHPAKAGVMRRGIAINSANTTVKNSYIEGFGFQNEETQGIAGWTGTRKVKILNNYIEGGAENILFGGSDPASADLVPTDIEIRGNHLNKPEAWRGKTTLKTLFELKNSRHVEFAENYLENNWLGSAFRITVRNQDGEAAFSTVEDTNIHDNIVNGAGEGINILGKDDTHPSGTLKRLTITNNLFLNIGNDPFEGSGYFVQVADGEDITIANNTVFNTGNITSFYAAIPRNFVLRDNIIGHGAYGVHGIDTRGPAAAAMFQNNLIVNNKRVGDGDRAFPSGNIWLADFGKVGFAAMAQNDYSLTPGSKFKSAAKNRSDIGASTAKLPLGELKKP